MHRYPRTQAWSYSDLRPALIKLTDDHNRIRGTVDQLQRLAKEAQEAGVALGSAAASRLHDQAMELNRELERHGQWEDEELFQLITELFPIERHPYLMTSLWMLEKEHQQADVCFEAYFAAVQVGHVRAGRVDLRYSAELLLRACRLVMQHLESEEDILLPLQEQLPADVMHVTASAAGQSVQ